MEEGSDLTGILLPIWSDDDQPHFPGEHSFDRILAILHTHLKLESPSPSSSGRPTEPEISRELIFAVYHVLTQDARVAPSTLVAYSVLPAVLRCFKQSWRLLPPEERSVDFLALQLASLVNCAPSSFAADSPRRAGRPLLRIKWIGRDDGTDSDLLPTVRACYESDQAGDAASVLPIAKPTSVAHPPTNSPACQHVHSAAYRNGCCACRRPRILEGSISVSVLNAFNTADADHTKLPMEPKLVDKHSPLLLRSEKEALEPPLDTLDQNVPPRKTVLRGNVVNIGPSRRSVRLPTVNKHGSTAGARLRPVTTPRISTVAITTTNTGASSSHPHPPPPPLSRFSFSHNSTAGGLPRQRGSALPRPTTAVVATTATIALKKPTSRVINKREGTISSSRLLTLHTAKNKKTDKSPNARVDPFSKPSRERTKAKRVIP
jgi:hypothetical protein